MPSFWLLKFLAMVVRVIPYACVFYIHALGIHFSFNSMRDTREDIWSLTYDGLTYAFFDFMIM
jgi:hypothetical protein